MWPGFLPEHEREMRGNQREVSVRGANDKLPTEHQRTLAERHSEREGQQKNERERERNLGSLGKPARVPVSWVFEKVEEYFPGGN